MTVYFNSDENQYSFPLSFIIANFARQLKAYSDDNKLVSFDNPGYRFISTKSGMYTNRYINN